MSHTLKTAICCLISLLLHTTNYAHVGGHFHQGDGTVFNTWQLLNGQTVSGNFTMGNNSYIILEQAEGRFLKLPIISLSPQAQKLAMFKIKQYNRLNSNFVQNEYLETKTVWHYGNMLVLMLFVMP